MSIPAEVPASAADRVFLPFQDTEILPKVLSYDACTLVSPQSKFSSIRIPLKFPG